MIPIACNCGSSLFAEDDIEERTEPLKDRDSECEIDRRGCRPIQSSNCSSVGCAKTGENAVSRLTVQGRIAFVNQIARSLPQILEEELFSKCADNGVASYIDERFATDDVDFSRNKKNGAHCVNASSVQPSGNECRTRSQPLSQSEDGCLSCGGAGCSMCATSGCLSCGGHGCSMCLKSLSRPTPSSTVCAEQAASLACMSGSVSALSCLSCGGIGCSMCLKSSATNQQTNPKEGRNPKDCLSCGGAGCTLCQGPPAATGGPMNGGDCFACGGHGCGKCRDQ